MRGCDVPQVSRGSGRVNWLRVLLYAVLVVFAAFYLMPIYVMVNASLKSFAEVSVAEMWKLPRDLSLEAFTSVWKGNRSQGLNSLSGFFLNSVYLTVPATIISTAIGSLNGYIFSKWRFRGSYVLFVLFLFGMFIPYQSILIPLVEVLRKLGVYGSIPGLVLTHTVYGIPITTLIFRNYYTNTPTELVESAKMDGAGFYQIYRWVILPVSLPALAVVGIWQFTSIWNNYLFAVVLTQNPSVQPITVGLVNLAGSYFVAWNVQMAGALIAALPTLLVYIFLSRYFLSGLMSGALKG